MKKLILMILITLLTTVAFAELPISTDDVKPDEDASSSPVHQLIGKTFVSNATDGGIMHLTFMNDHRNIFSYSYNNCTAVLYNIEIKLHSTGYTIEKSDYQNTNCGVFAETKKGENFEVKILDENQILLILDGKYSFLYKLLYN